MQGDVIQLQQHQRGEDDQQPDREHIEALIESPPDFVAEVAAKLRRCRLALQMTPEVAAAYLNRLLRVTFITADLVDRWERGADRIPADYSLAMFTMTGSRRREIAQQLVTLDPRPGPPLPGIRAARGD